MEFAQTTEEKDKGSPRDSEGLRMSGGEEQQLLEGTFVSRIDKKYDDIGGFGRFQIFAFIIQTWGISCTNWFLYGLGYFT